MKVFVFEGGESVDHTNAHEIAEWSKDSIIALLSDLYDAVKENEPCDWLSNRACIRDTFRFVGSSMAELGLDPYNGGMIYVVKG